MNMTRKEFLQTVGGAATTAAMSSSSIASGAGKANLKRGVSLYSYQDAFYTRAMSLEDCLAEAASIGAREIQLLPEEMVPDFPNPSDKWVGQWKDWMAKYDLVADTYCQFQDTVLIKGQDLSLDEGMEMLERDLKLANRMGFTKMRMLIGTPIDVMEKGLPLAEKYNVWMGCEVHAPARTTSRLVQRWVEVIEKHKTKYFGILPDFGIFQDRPNRVQRDRNIRDGTLSEAATKYIEEEWQKGTPKEKVAEAVAKMATKPGDASYVDQVYRIKMQDPKELVPFKDYIRNFHAKFWEMTENYQEYSIPCEKVIPALIAAGFSATLSSEYEGQRAIQDVYEVDECEQVRRHHVMMKRLLGA
jgi:hypothetical protein